MPLLSIVIPVYNEERHLRRVLEHLFSAPCPVDREWIVVDDGSKDNSPAVLRDLQKEYDFRLFEQDGNQGKGAAVIRGIREATGDFIGIQDADFEYDPRDICALIQPLLEGEADAVYGSRFKRTTPRVNRTYHYFANRFLTLLSNLLSGIYLTDMETCYKFFRADLLKSMNLTRKRFGIEVEMTAYLAKTRARIFELPINYYPRTRLQGKKINWRDGVAAIGHLIYCNLFVSLDKAFTALPRPYHPTAGQGPWYDPVDESPSPPRRED